MYESFIWSRPELMERHYVLRRGEVQAGEVVFAEAFSTVARATVPGSVWTFHRKGVMKPVVSVRRDGESEDLLVAVAAAGELTITGPEGYRWKAVSVSRGEFAWHDAAGAPLIRYRPRLSGSSIEQDIEILAPGLPEERKLLLVLLGGYLLALAYTETAMMTGAFIAAAIVS